jgi:hypothetical protein
MFDEVRYFHPDDDKLSGLRLSNMSDPPVTPQRHTKQKNLKNTIFHICVQYDQGWGVYK